MTSIIEEQVSDQQLGRAATHGILWKSLVNILGQVFQFAVTIVLARLLFPEDYGVVGMAVIFTGLVGTVNNLGLTAALIQRKQVQEEHLSSAFWAMWVMGVAICLLNIAAAPFVAWYFKKPIVSSIVMVNAMGFIIYPLGRIHDTLLHRRLQFRTVALIELCFTLVTGTLQLTLAWMGLGPWSLVLGDRAADVINVLMLWHVCPWRPRFHFSLQHFRELFWFGKNSMGSNVATYFIYNMDYMIVGRVLGASALGYYTLAFRLMSLPQRYLVNILAPVLFPAFSRLQGDDARMRSAFLRSITYIAAVCFPILYALMVVAPELMMIVYSAKWKPAILPLQIMCVAGSLYALSNPIWPVFLAKGRPDLTLRINLFLRMGVLGLFLMIGARFGIAGVAVATSVFAVIMTPLIMWLMGKQIHLPLKDCLKVLTPVGAGTCLMVAAMAAFRHYAGGFLDMRIALVLNILLGGAVYLVSMHFLQRDLLLSLAGLMRPGSRSKAPDQAAS